MSTIPLGEVIAERRLRVVDEDRALMVRLGRPRIYGDGETYSCPFTIVGVEDEEIKEAYGFDALQALMLALRMISVEISLRNQSYGGRLRWDGDDGGDLGFSVPA